MTERSFTMSSTGPVRAEVELPAGSVEVQVSGSVTTAQVVVRTADESGPAADAVARAALHEEGQRLMVRVPELPTAVTQSINGHRVVQHAGVVTGSVTGVTIKGGQVFTGTGDAGAVSPILVRLVLPAGSSLAMASTSAGLSVYGPLDQATFRSVSGDCRFDLVADLVASTTSGDIIAGPLLGSVIARSVSGDIEADPYAGDHAELTTTSGDIKVEAASSSTGRLAARTISGDIHVRGGRHLDLRTRTVSGRVRA